MTVNGRSFLSSSMYYVPVLSGSVGPPTIRVDHARTETTALQRSVMNDDNQLALDHSNVVQLSCVQIAVSCTERDLPVNLNKAKLGLPPTLCQA